MSVDKNSRHDEIVWNAQEASVVTGGENSQEWSATGISMNINEVTPGDLFVASPDDDLDLVFKKGAAAVMMARGSGGHDLMPVMKVTGIYEALQGLAKAARFRTHATVISVQGKEARISIQNLLSKAGKVHAAGRHLSLALAGLPVDVDYGVFGSSPAVKPDVAIITDSSMANRDTLFQTMSGQGSVFVNADDESFLSVVARAKAAGVPHVYTYGAREGLDAHVISNLEADNGSRVSVSLLGEDYTFLLPKGFDFNASILAALLVLKVTDKCLVSAIESFASLEKSSTEDEGVMLIDPSQAPQYQAAFRITNMIDLGFGRQTAILDNIARGAMARAENSGRLSVSLKKGFAIPARLANLNFVYTSKGNGTLTDAKAVIQERHRDSAVESIAPEVVAPGDFLVFKNVWDSSKSALSEALRIVPEGNKTTHAV